jgi:hypothetical protein
MRSVSSTPGHQGTVPHDEETDTSELGAEFFGTYSVILPPEPFIFGVSHIPQRSVLAHCATILRHSFRSWSSRPLCILR